MEGERALSISLSKKHSSSSITTWSGPIHIRLNPNNHGVGERKRDKQNATHSTNQNHHHRHPTISSSSIHIPCAIIPNSQLPHIKFQSFTHFLLNIRAEILRIPKFNFLATGFFLSRYAERSTLCYRRRRHQRWKYLLGKKGRVWF